MGFYGMLINLVDLRYTGIRYPIFEHISTPCKDWQPFSAPGRFFPTLFTAITRTPGLSHRSRENKGELA